MGITHDCAVFIYTAITHPRLTGARQRSQRTGDRLSESVADTPTAPTGRLHARKSPRRTFSTTGARRPLQGRYNGLFTPFIHVQGYAVHGLPQAHDQLEQRPQQAS